MGKFIISKNKEGEFKFDFIDKKQTVILSSTKGYKKKRMCVSSIEAVKRSSQDQSKFYRKRHPNDQTYFNLKSFNGVILATSQPFDDKDSRDRSIESLQNKALDAIIEDLS